MEIDIQELHTEIEVTDPGSVLTPAVLAQVTEAVLAELKRRDQAARARATELDLRPVVEQQRRARGGS